MKKNLLGDLGKKIRKLRQEQQLSIQKLAHKAGLSPASVYKIEIGAMTPSVVNLLKIAKSLGKKVSFFIEDNIKLKDVEFVKKNERRKFYISQSKYTVEVLSARLEDCKMNAGILQIEAGGNSGEKPLSHIGEEIIYCSKGMLYIKIGEEEYFMKPGDCIHFKCENPHYWENKNKNKTEIFYIITPPALSLT